MPFERQLFSNSFPIHTTMVYLHCKAFSLLNDIKFVETKYVSILLIVVNQPQNAIDHKFISVICFIYKSSERVSSSNHERNL